MRAGSTGILGVPSWVRGHKGVLWLGGGPSWTLSWRGDTQGPCLQLRSQVGPGRCLSVDSSLKARQQAAAVLQHFHVCVAPSDIFRRCQVGAAAPSGTALSPAPLTSCSLLP